MNQSTIKKLIEINRVFYQTVGTYFDSSRNYFWPGWEKIIPHISELSSSLDRPMRVLDIGCGNARFLEFIAKRFSGIGFSYAGIDFSHELLSKAEERCKNYMDSSICNLYEIDILTDSWEKAFTEEKFDLIVLFGVMHHVPSFENRRLLLSRIKNLLSPEGILVVTHWRYGDSDRLKRRIVNPFTKEGSEVFKELGIAIDDLEQNDNILDWNRGIKGYRYSHFVDNQESQEFIDELNMPVLSRFLEDGKERNVNEYVVLKNSG